MKRIIICILVLLSCNLHAQENNRKLKFNVGLKIGFQAITYNDPTFEINGYTYNENTIQSNKIGHTIAPFLRASFGRFYIQTDATFGIARHSFDFTDTRESNFTGINPNIPQYDLKTYCLQVPLLIGYEFIKQEKYGMSLFTGPRTRFTFTSLDKQQFKHFYYEELDEVLKKKTYYWEAGLGIKIYNVFFDFVYDLGLTEASRYIKNPQTGQKFKTKRKNNILSFSVGVIF